MTLTRPPPLRMAVPVGAVLFAALGALVWAGT